MPNRKSKLILLHEINYVKSKLILFHRANFMSWNKLSNIKSKKRRNTSRDESIMSKIYHRMIKLAVKLGSFVFNH